MNDLLFLDFWSYAVSTVRPAMTRGGNGALGWVLLAAVLTLAGRVGAEPKFLGVLGTANDGTFFAVSSADDAPSKWRRIGDRIDGYVISAYRPKQEQLVLRQGAEELVLALKVAKVREGPTRIDESSVRRLASEIVATWKDWEGANCEFVVWYGTDWNIAAVRIVGEKKETRIIASPDGFKVSAPR